MFVFVEMHLSLKRNTLLFAGHLFNYALATYLGCSAEVFFPGGHCSDFSVFGVGGQGVFLPEHMGDGLVFCNILI